MVVTFSMSDKKSDISRSRGKLSENLIIQKGNFLASISSVFLWESSPVLSGAGVWCNRKGTVDTTAGEAVGKRQGWRVGMVLLQAWQVEVNLMTYTEVCFSLKSGFTKAVPSPKLPIQPCLSCEFSIYYLPLKLWFVYTTNWPDKTYDITWISSHD